MVEWDLFRRTAYLKADAQPILSMYRTQMESIFEKNLRRAEQASHFTNTPWSIMNRTCSEQAWRHVARNDTGLRGAPASGGTLPNSNFRTHIASYDLLVASGK